MQTLGQALKTDNVLAPLLAQRCQRVVELGLVLERQRI